MQRIIRFCLNHPFWIIAIVALVTVLFASQVPKIKMDPRVEVVLREDNPAVQLFVQNKQNFEPYADIIIGMFDTDIFSRSSLEKLQKIVRELEEVDGIQDVHYVLNVKNIQGSESGLDVAPMVRDDTLPLTEEEIVSVREKVHSWDVYQDVYVTRDGTGTAISAILEEDVETDQIVPIYFAITKILETYEGPEKFYVSGTKVLEALQSHYMIKDLILLPSLVCIVLLGFLFVFFRNIRGMLLPLACVGLSAIWTVGVMAIVNVPLTVVTTALPVALMACGSAYGIHVVENVLADAAVGKRGKKGISGAIGRITIPVTMAALTTMAAFTSLCTTTIVPLMNMGLLCAFGLAVAMSLSLTFIPAVMVLLDTHGKELVPHHHSKKDIIAPLLRQFSRISLQRSWWVVGLSFVVLAISMYLGSYVKSDLNLIEDFRKRSPIRIADTILNEKFGGTSVFHVVFETVQPDDIKEPSVLKKIDALQHELMELPHVGKAVSIVDFIKRMNQAMHDGDPAYYTIPESKELIAQYLLLFSFSGGEGELDSFVDYNFQKAQIILQKKSLSGYHAQEVVDTVERFREHEVSGEFVTDIITTGLAMMAKEFNHIVVTSQVRSFIISFFLCFIITSFIFRTFKLGFYSMMPLIIPIALDFAIMGVTGIKLNAATATVASIDIGMGIDYSIHFLNRYRHELRLGHPVEKAIDIALNTSGRGIIYNALAVAAGFLVLVPSQFVIISQMGILVAVDMITIAISALTFLPACIKLHPPKLLIETPSLNVVEVHRRPGKKDFAAPGYDDDQSDLDSGIMKRYHHEDHE
ncbi:MAG: efflux RND transporter permease subunit [Desulfomonilia bacterium]